METKDVVQKGNSLNAKLTITNYNTPFAAKTSPEYVISGVAVFQVKLIAAQVYNGHTNVYNNLVFVRFTKRRAGDDLTYTLKFNSLELNIKNKCFTSDDGTWHLIFENKKQQFTFDVAVCMEVMPCASSFASLHDDTELTDFELRGEDGSVHMHRAVLAAASPVLRRMLGGEWRETAEGHVDVTGTSKATLQHFKNYVYLHTLPESGLEQLLLLSTYYLMPELEQRCVDKLVHSVSAVTACDMIEFAAKHKVTRLLLAILECVQNGAISVTEMRDQFALTEMQTQELTEQTDNSLKVKFVVDYYPNITHYNTCTSREFVIGGAAGIQVKVSSTLLNNINGSNNRADHSYKNLVFVRCTKRGAAGDDLTFTFKFNSNTLTLTNKCDDGSWHLLYENPYVARGPFQFYVACDMEVMQRTTSFASLHDDTELTDFELRGEDGSVNMHRAVLAAASPVLRRMLCGEWRETAEGRVDVTGTSKATLQHLKDYLYLRTLPESGLEQLLPLSTYYMMPELEQRCVDKLVHNLTAVNAHDMIEFAVQHKATRLLLAILKSVQNGAIKVTEIRGLN